MTNLVHNSTTGRRAEFSYLGAGIFSFKVFGPSGDIVASGSGSEADVETRAAYWVNPPRG